MFIVGAATVLASTSKSFDGSLAALPFSLSATNSSTSHARTLGGKRREEKQKESRQGAKNNIDRLVMALAKPARGEQQLFGAS